MGLLMNSTPILVCLLAFVNCVAADIHYIGPTVGGIVGLIILIVDIIAAVEILRSGKPLVEKTSLDFIHHLFSYYWFDCLFTLWSFSSCWHLKQSKNDLSFFFLYSFENKSSIKRIKQDKCNKYRNSS